MPDPIIVVTSGPIGADTTLKFSDMVAAIADDIDDTTSEYAEAIQRAVLSAIRFSEREVYYFNETRDETFPTIDGQEWYDGDDNGNIPTLVRIVAAFSEDASGQRTSLIRSTPEELEILADNSSSRGEPSNFTYFGRRIRLYPIPDAEQFTIRLQLGPYRLSTLADLADTNAWITEAYDMVKARAKYILAKDTLKDAAMAAEALNDYSEQHNALKAETSRRNGTGRIRPTRF